MVSVIVPVHNTESYLRECVDSLLAQTFIDFELILVDDGSTDASGRICDAYTAAEARVKAVHTPRCGQAAARNRGIEMAEGDTVAFVDSDDVVHPSYLQVLLDLRERTGADIAMSGITRSRKSLSCHAVHSDAVFKPLDALERILYQEMPGAHAVAKLYSRSLFDRIRFREGLCYEDLLLAAELYPESGSVALTDAPTYFYRRNSQSTTSVFTTSRLDVLEVTRIIEERFAGSELEAAARSRRFSAACHVLREIHRHPSVPVPGAEAECLDIIRSLRRDILSDRRVRLKNKLGAVVSMLGPWIFKLLSRL